MKTALDILKGIATAVVGLLFLGFYVKGEVNMPGYAVVYVDDDAKDILAPQCVDEWKKANSDHFGVVRRTTADMAYKLGYSLDTRCAADGAFIQEGPSLTFRLLAKLGVTSTKKYWWDMPYRTESGVVYPHK